MLQMPMTNYGELRSTVQTWMDRNDPLTVKMIPDFIYLAEKQIMKTLFGMLTEIPSLENEVEVQCYPFTDFIDMPADMGRIKYIYLPHQKRPLKVTTYPELLDMDDETYVDDESQGGPRFYARHIKRIYFRPTPPTFQEPDPDVPELINYSSIPIRVVYVRDPTAFREDTESSYLLTTCPEILLYGALAYGYDFIKDYENKMLCEKKLMESIGSFVAQLKSEDIPDTKSIAYPDQTGDIRSYDMYPYL